MRSTPFSTLLSRLLSRLLSCLLLFTVVAALSACGPGGPKPATPDTGGGGGTPGSSGGGISLVAGNAGLSGRADGQGSDARFNTPRGIAIDSSGNLFVADSLNYAIRKITPDGTVSTFAGTLGLQLAAGTGDGNGSRARFSQPTAIAIDAANNLFVTDGYAIRKITPAAEVSTLATMPSGSLSTNVQFQPAGIGVDGFDNLVVTTSVDLHRLTADSNYRTSVTLETGLAFDYSLAPGTLAPRGVVVDASNVTSFADLGNTISRVQPNSNVPLRFAGVQGSRGNTDGLAGGASFGQVVALTVDRNGTLYAADAGNFTVRKITSEAVTSTAAGRAGTDLYSTGRLPGTLTTMRGITNDGNGNLYVTEGNAVVKITLQ
jgi:streptogramin lyase